MAAVKSEKKELAIVGIERLQRATLEVLLLGTSALIQNRMPAKAKQQLLWPKERLNKAAREQTQKHNPIAEFHDAIYRCRDDNAPTLLHMPAGAFKKAMAQAAVDTPGATKAETGRLVKIIDETVHIYGLPFLHMSVVRQAGIARTPDVRTRAILPQWAAKLTIQYIRTRIKEQDISNLLGNAGDICGIGDGRTEKGTFDYGSWTIVTAAEVATWKAIVREQGRKAQIEAMKRAVPYDADTEELLSWYQTEVVRREKVREKDRAPKLAVVANKRKRNDGAGEAPVVA